MNPLHLSLLILTVCLSTIPAFAQVSILKNGEFESGLSGWQAVASDVGVARVTNSTSHSGVYSLLLELWPTNMMADIQIVAVSQTVQVTGPATLEAWYMSPSCQFPAGDIEGRLVIMIGTATVQQILGATCGSWQSIQQNITGNGSVVIELELARSLTLTQYALTSYWSIYWDDVSVQTAQVTTTTTVQSAISISTTDNTPANTTQLTTSTLDEGLAETTFTVGSLAVIMLAAFLFLVARKREESNMVRCRRCGIMNRGPLTYCVACGARAK